jgi:biopolymer transport protein ExbD
VKFYTRRPRRPSIVIVSLIDILVLLLIFFVVTTRFIAEQPAVQVNLAKSDAAEATESAAPVIVTVTEKGEVFLGSNRVDPAALADGIRAAASTAQGFALKADTASQFGVVLQVLDAFKKAGVQDVPAFTAPRNAPAVSP